MRTTLTLDDDVAGMLEVVRRAEDISLKEAVNRALRDGLTAHERAPAETRPFQTAVVDLGEIRIKSIDDVADVLAVAEGDSFR